MNLKNITFILTILCIISIVWIIACLSICQLRNSINLPSITSVSYQLAIAYIISYVFYLITVYLPDYKNRKNINEYVIPRTKNIIGDGYFVFNELAKKAGFPDSEFPPTQEKLREILKKVNPQTNDAPMTSFDGHVFNYLEYLNYRRVRSKNFIKRILYRMPYLETDLVKILSIIDECGYFGQLESLPLIIKNKDLTFITSVLFSYFKDIDNLEKFTESKYDENTKYKDLFLGK